MTESATAPDPHPKEMVRPYVITRNRTRPLPGLTLDSLVFLRPEVEQHPPAHGGPLTARVIQRCSHGPASVGEIASDLKEPVLLTKIAVSNLIDDGVLSWPGPQTPVDVQLLQRLSNGIRKKFPHVRTAN